MRLSKAHIFVNIILLSCILLFSYSFPSQYNNILNTRIPVSVLLSCSCPVFVLSGGNFTQDDLAFIDADLVNVANKEVWTKSCLNSIPTAVV